MKTSIITVTPAMAQLFLNSNADFQRNLRIGEVKTLAAAMQRGEWVLTHQGVAFDSEGRLIDGQHRLHAIIMANMPQDMLVVEGVDPAAFKVLDIGAKRSTSDLLSIDKKEAGVVSFFARMKGSKRPSPQQCFSVYQEYLDQIQPVVRATTGKKNIFHSTAFQSAAVLQLKLTPEHGDYVLDVFRKMGSMDLEALPTVGTTAIKAAAMGKLRTGGGTDRQILFATGMKVMNPLYKDSSKVPSKLQDTEYFMNIAQAEICR